MPTNEQRAGWVKAALNTYCHLTRNEGWDGYVSAPSKQEVEANQHEVVSDFVCDLMHLTDDLFGGDFDGVLSRGREHYVAEIEEGAGETDPLDKIASILHATEWDSGMLETVAEIIRRTGREVGPPADDDACDCANDLVPGAAYPVEHDGDSSRAWVERCDNCGLFPDDWEAAMAVAMKLGVGWTHSGGAPCPWLVDPITRNALPFGYKGEEVS